jgi:hypothetical protein
VALSYHLVLLVRGLRGLYNYTFNLRNDGVFITGWLIRFDDLLLLLLVSEEFVGNMKLKLMELSTSELDVT